VVKSQDTGNAMVCMMERGTYGGLERNLVLFLCNSFLLLPSVEEEERENSSFIIRAIDPYGPRREQ